MKRFFTGIFLITAAVMTTQGASLSVEVSAVTGEPTQGLTVNIFGEESGWVFNPVKVNANGVAKFSYVPEGVFTLTVDGSPMGLEYYTGEVEMGSTDTTVSVELAEAVRTPYALQVALEHNDFTGENSATLSWNRETDYFFDDFESYEPFAINFAPWTGIDVDKEPAAEIQGGYPNRGTQQYATIFNPLAIDPPVYYEYEVLRPWSGKQCVGFVRTRSGNANNDWLISPKIKVGVNNIVSFMAKASEYQPDRFAVCISTTGTEVKDFVQLTPGNYQTVDYKQWYEIAYDLSKYEGEEVYIAIHCVSQNSFMLMVDDFYVGPAAGPSKARRVSRRSADNPNEKFIIMLDGVKAGETEDYTFDFDNLSAGNHTVGITATYIKSQSEEATIEFSVPEADDFAALTVNLSSDIDYPLEGIKIYLLNTATARQTVLQADADGSARVGFIAKGEYMVNVDSEIFDVYNGTFTLDGDMELNINLAETITDPYNVLYQTNANEDGTFDVELTWNQDLGFRDSFEDYADFTQEFGDWTVLDLDRMPTYAFSIAGTMITLPESRGEVGAMIFNPYATRPVQASDDGLFLAPDGDKYVMFSSAEQAYSDDWLISPTLRIGKDYVVRFTAKSYDITYPGSFEFYAMKDKLIDRAEYLDGFYLTNDWLRYEISLSKYEGESIEFGFHHVTPDGWLSFVDDFYVGPSEEADTSDESTARCDYDVFLNGDFVANVSEPVYTFSALREGEYKAGLQALYPSGRKSNVTEVEFTIVGAGVTRIEKPQESWRYYDLNGIEVKAENLGKGIYLRTNGTSTEKVTVR